MNTIQDKTILAHSIGLCRIAVVVDKFCDLVQAHPTLAEPFRVLGDWGDRKALLTYFWWVTLGGKRTGDVHFAVIPKHAGAGFNAELLQNWATSFRQVVLSVVGKELTDAWMEKASRLGRKLLISNDYYSAKLAKAS